jgi:hypothetical protein
VNGTEGRNELSLKINKKSHDILKADWSYLKRFVTQSFIKCPRFSLLCVLSVFVSSGSPFGPA